MARERNLQYKTVNDKLRKNHEILSAQLLGALEVIVPRADLEKQGVDFSCITGVTSIENTHVPAVYDLAFRVRNDDTVLIRRLGTLP